MFADSYFQKSGNFKPLIRSQVDKETALIVVIPCYQEPDILNALSSLLQCEPTQGKAEVIIMINEPEGCPEEVSAYNRNTFLQLFDWVGEHSGERISFLPAGPVRLPVKWAGAGLARKTGMDEAVHRFNLINKPEGIIVSLDADTLVEKNYLVAIEDHFRQHKEDIGVTLRFSHQTSGLTERHLQGILLYEKYLRFYKNALSSTGYPYARYTIGSAFAVKADAYVKRGGMTRRKAGEDFYFLQTLAWQGNVGELNTTTVHPSARISHRVPFGTGLAMQKWMEGSDDLHYSYDIQAFRDLKFLFSFRSCFYKSISEDYRTLVSRLPEAVRVFLKEDNLQGEFEQLSQNCSRQEIFDERFFQVFNAFRILKFLNFAHPRFYAKTLIEESFAELMKDHPLQ